MKRKSKGGGIYRAIQVKGTEENPEEMKAAAIAAKAAFAEWQDLDGQLARLGTEARRLLDTKPPEAMGDEAAELLRLLGELREHLDRADARSAALAALYIGAACERLRIRPLGPLVQRGREALENVEEARLSKQKLTRQRHAQIRQRVKERMDANSKDSRSYAMERVAAQLQDEGEKISLSTVKRACKRK